MKQEDINRLKEICEKEGFELEIPGEAYFSGKQVFTITKKGPWDRADFVKVIDTNGLLNVTLNKIYKLIDCRFGEVRFKNDRNELDARNCIHGNFVSATESEYLEQLKKEVFERFGDIKDGDMFQIPEGGDAILHAKGAWAEPFTYWKKYDRLTYCGLILYQSGKWATKLTTRVKVELEDFKPRNIFYFTTSNEEIYYNMEKAGEFLAQQLENYLNDNQE